MDQNTAPDTQQAPEELVMTLELVADEQEGDPALVNAVGRDTVAALQQQGYTVRPVYTGQKGGEFFVEVWTAVSQAATMVWNTHPVVAEVITDVSGLITIFGYVVPTLKQMFHAHEERVGKEESVSNPITFVLEIDGAPLPIEVSDVKQADAVPRLTQRFCHEHPTVAPKVTTKSKVKGQGRVRGRKRRPRK